MQHRVVVTGAEGWIGRQVVLHLLKVENVEVLAFGRPGSRLPGVYGVDLTDDALGPRLASLRPTHVIHAAGRTGGSTLAMYRDNTAATVMLGQALIRHEVDAILTILGSAAEYGRPETRTLLPETSLCQPAGVYGHSKVAAHAALSGLAREGLRLNWLRIFNPLSLAPSPHQVFGVLIGKLRGVINSDGPTRIDMGPLGATRDFVLIDDLLCLLEKLVVSATAGLVSNVCSGRGLVVRDLAQALIKFTGLQVDLHEASPDTGQTLVNDVVVGDPGRFTYVLGRAPSTDAEGMLKAAWRHVCQTVS